MIEHTRPTDWHAIAAEGDRVLSALPDAASAIDARQPFRNGGHTFTGQLFQLTRIGAAEARGGAIYGRMVLGNTVQITRTGGLPAAWADRLAADMTASGVIFIVYSYETPIAWTTAAPVAPGEATGGPVTVPNVRYSPTTDRHQWAAAGARGAAWVSLEGSDAAEVPRRP